MTLQAMAEQLAEFVTENPNNAIHVDTGKDMMTCAAFMDKNKATYAPRHGCGKCQLKLPCATRRPGKA